MVMYGKMSNKLLEDYWFKRANKEIKNEDILYDYIFKNPNKTRIELLEILVKKKIPIKAIEGVREEMYKTLMSYATFHKHLKKLREKGKIIKDKPKTYSINPNYVELSEGSEKQLKLMFEKELNKIRDTEILDVTENQLWYRIHDKMALTYNFGEELRDKLFFSNEINILIGRLFLSLIRECIIMNPELWQIMNKPEHFNFTFNLECNFQKDPKIFEIIKEIREKCIEREEVHLFLFSPFSRKIGFNPSEDLQTLELRESKIDKLKFKIDRPLKELYYNAVGQDTLLRNHWEKEEREKKEDFEGYIKKQVGDLFINNISYYRKKEKMLGEREEFKELYKERQEKIDKEVKKLQDKAKERKKEQEKQ